MVDKVLYISTVLGKVTQPSQNDELLLTVLDGQEHISKSFRFEVTVFRRRAKPEIDPRNLLGTSATFGIFGEDIGGNKHYVLRTGVFSEIHRLGAVADAADRDSWVYFGVIISAFEFLGSETRYRVFENKTVVDVLDVCLSDMKNRFPDFKYDVSSIKKTKFPTDFYVQYGESTFGFLNRLMARHGIFYFFGQSADDQKNASVPVNDTLVLGRERYKTAGLAPVELPENLDMRIIHNPSQEISGRRPPNAITEFKRMYLPSMPATGLRSASVIDFNVLDPTVPNKAKDDIIPLYDEVGGGEQGGPGSFLNSTALTAIALKPSNWPAADLTPAQDSAEVLLQRPESYALQVSGSCQNRFFRAATLFQVTQDSTIDQKAPAPAKPDGLNSKKFVVTTLHITGTENSYKTTTKQDIDSFFKPLTDILSAILAIPRGIVGGIEALFGAGGINAIGQQFKDLWNSVIDFFKSQSKNDVMMNYTAQGISNYLQNEGSDRALHALYPSKSPDSMGIPAAGRPFWGYFFGGVLANFATVLPNLLSSPLKLIGNVLIANDGSYSNSFVATPYDASVGFRLRPSPITDKPRTRGPQLATVIGEKGKSTERGDIYADAFGRVRIRFPWDPGPPNDSGSGTQDPWKSGLNTCWVRVVEGWAGEKFGTQFLPRIGQEVLVDFVDGDPERPVITGRMYNANMGPANLPFPPKPPASKITNDYLLDPKDPPPGDTMRRSGIKTRITALKGEKEKFHLLRFDDDADHTQFLLRSQGRLDITAFSTRYESIYSDRHLTVGGKKITPPPKEIGGDYIAKVFRHYYLHVGDPEFPTQSGNRSTKLEQSDYIHVVKNSGQQVDGNWSVTTGGQATIDANGMASGGTIVLNATVNITLKCGPSTIVMTPSSIAITSPMVLINSGGPAPIPPIDATNIPLVEPSAADPGDDLTAHI